MLSNKRYLLYITVVNVLRIMSFHRCQPSRNRDFGLFPAFPHVCEKVPDFWLYFEIIKIFENCTNFSCTETFYSKKLCVNVNDSVA